MIQDMVCYNMPFAVIVISLIVDIGVGDQKVPYTLLNMFFLLYAYVCDLAFGKSNFKDYPNTQYHSYRSEIMQGIKESFINIRISKALEAASSLYY